MDKIEILVICLLISFILTLLGIREALSSNWQQISSQLKKELNN
jgi:hypothetical protein